MRWAGLRRQNWATNQPKSRWTDLRGDFLSLAELTNTLYVVQEIVLGTPMMT